MSNTSFSADLHKYLDFTDYNVKLQLPGSSWDKGFSTVVPERQPMLSVILKLLGHGGAIWSVFFKVNVGSWLFFSFAVGGQIKSLFFLLGDGLHLRRNMFNPIK